MIQMLVNNEFLDLPNSLQIDFVEDNNLFSFLHIPGEHSWSFELPSTPRNRRILGFPDNIQTLSSVNHRVPCSILNSGAIARSGYLNFEEQNDNSFSVYFTGSVGSIKSDMENLKLRELDWPTITVSGLMKNHAKTVVDEGYSLHDYTFANVMYVGEDFVGFANEVDLGNINHYFYENNIWIPLPYAYNIIQRACAHLDINLKSNFFAEDEMRRLILINAMPINDRDEDGNWDVSFTGSFNISLNVPDLKFSEYLLGLSQFFNLSVRYNIFSNTLEIEPRSTLLSIDKPINFDKRLLSYRVLSSKIRSYNFLFAHPDNHKSAYHRNLDLLSSDPAADDLEIPFGIPAGENAITGLNVALGHPIGEECPSHLAFFRAVDYPQQTPGHHLPMPIITADLWPGDQYAVKTSGPGNFYDTFWSRFASTYEKMPLIEAEIKLYPADLALFNPTKAYRFDRFIGFFHHLEYSLTNDQIVDAKAKIFIA